MTLDCIFWRWTKWQTLTDSNIHVCPKLWAAVEIHLVLQKSYTQNCYRHNWDKLNTGKVKGHRIRCWGCEINVAFSHQSSCYSPKGWVCSRIMFPLDVHFRTATNNYINVILWFIFFIRDKQWILFQKLIESKLTILYSTGCCCKFNGLTVMASWAGMSKSGFMCGGQFCSNSQSLEMVWAEESYSYVEAAVRPEEPSTSPGAWSFSSHIPQWHLNIKT